ncbi:hypothetical protein [Actinoplanes sp. NBRC 103695]|uniref:hypothetical protein n=1 Tax=Actinoplanes sp. NBRC 103695 TaxID=3032202 RepID=UPI0024A3DBBD|nr:hypothetical protein [Actinoplanes sp. NBRC 103695]GLY96589.1 hypothetical protein Acsp02_38440 [Actinoplanes sp. NBRC 103695]
MTYGYAPHPMYVQQQPPAHRSAPVSVHFIAILHYLGGAIYLLTAAGAGLLAATGGLDHLDTSRIQISQDEQLVATVTTVAVLAVLGLITIWFGRRLQLGRQWARVLLMTLLLLTVAAIAAGTWVAQDPTVLIALVQPAFYLMLLNTRAARSWFKNHTW